MHGFSARLTPSQVSEIKKSPAHIAIHEESVGKLLTTHSPSFLGLRNSSGLWPASSYGEGMIIGLIDSGVWPESESFNDRGMPPIPARWKGKCDNSTTTSPFPCNKKLIGARTFIKANNSAEEDTSPRDSLGHGTHTASTAAGNHVAGASQFGYAKGIARGMAPRAHLAIYKVSNNINIVESDVIAAMDQAIADGVDVLSLSLVFEEAPYFKDVIAIASFSAIEKGIFVVRSAGNFGAYNSTLNGAPWITTVGAGTLDRSFAASVTLGNGATFEGESKFPENVLIANASLYYGKNDSKKAVCNLRSLDANETAGKVVFCDYAGITIIEEQINELNRIGAYAGIIATELMPFGALDNLSIPILVVNTTSGALIREYYAIRETKAEVKTMRFVHTNLGTKPAPAVAVFSSRGPDPINPSILKPDVIAPGVDILAAVPPFPYTRIGDNELVTDYAFKSGTSMAAPHVSGVAALLKAVHPDWSPAAIRSALMTTAYSINNNGTTLTNQNYPFPATPFDYGAGHINPNKAMDPGLIYDMDTQDYIDFLCSLGYTDTEMKAVLRQSQWNCTQKEITDLNYPSFVAIFGNEPNFPKVMNFSRVVTNVGDDQSIYQTEVGNSMGLTIKVEPSTLTFSKKYQKLSFVVSVEIDETAPQQGYGYLKWIDQRNHTVSSPIVEMNPNFL
ncbi:hypothetical protein COLO4_26541 [Corchorus olitorius]|uniref:Peptidase S8/S53 domain-containing protein n=1 Tax=Corchorus olitorius TaxID=93759 RepID=A0A1R3HWK4_9ROSI|nr:hypothetical protein COLO4_26541 [Corchorus olitorius]